MATNVIIRKSNQLIEARYSLTVGEQRIIFLLASQIHKDDEEFKTYRISIKDLARLFEIPYDGQLIDSVMGALRKLRVREFALYEDDIKEKYGINSRSTVGWISKAEYIDGHSSVDVRFSEELKPYYLKLAERFTRMPSESFVHFNCRHTFRFYEMLCSEVFKASRSGHFNRTFDYVELREKFGINADEYKYFKDFRLYVIEPAAKEISKYTDIQVLNITYEKNIGRHVSHIVFHCSGAKQHLLSLSGGSPEIHEVAGEKQEIKKEHPEDIRELISMGIDENTAYKWRKKYGVKRLISNIAYVRGIEKSGKIRESISGLIATAIVNNLAVGSEKLAQKKLEVRKAQENAEQEKTIIEKEEAKKARNELESILETFWTWPVSDQIETRRLFTDSIPDVMRKMWARDLIEKERPEELKMHTPLFCKFLKDGNYI